MKVALVYDWLNVKVGGGETTFFEIAELYPEADIFCLVYNAKIFDQYFHDRHVKASFLNHLPGFIKKRPYFMLPFIRRATESLNFDGYDLIISVSSAWVKNIQKPTSSVHITYCFSPARMLWDSWPHYLDSQHIGPFKLGPVSRFYVTRLASRLRIWDYYSSENVDSFIAISHYIGERIEKYYGREAQLVYPPVKIKPFKEVNLKKNAYFLCLSVLSQYKNIELVIAAFKKNGLSLKIAGDGPDRDRLELLAKGHKNITFLGRVDESTKVELMARAAAFIFPSTEDFGITPVEALAAGTPVVAYQAGGLTETIQDGKTGVFFDDLNVSSLNAAIEKCRKHHFSKSDIQKSAERFSDERFKNELVRTITQTYTKAHQK